MMNDAVLEPRNVTSNAAVVIVKNRPTQWLMLASPSVKGPAPQGRTYNGWPVRPLNKPRGARRDEVTQLSPRATVQPFHRLEWTASLEHTLAFLVSVSYTHLTLPTIYSV